MTSWLGAIPGWGGTGRVGVDPVLAGSFSWGTHLRQLLGEAGFISFNSALSSLKGKLQRAGQDAVDQAVLTLVATIEGNREESWRKNPTKSKKFAEDLANLDLLLQRANLSNQISTVMDTLELLGQPLEAFPTQFITVQILKALTNEQVAALQQQYGAVIDVLCVLGQDHETRLVLSTAPFISKGVVYVGCRSRLDNAVFTLCLSLYIPGYDLLEIETSTAIDSGQNLIHAIALLKAVITNDKDVNLAVFSEVENLIENFYDFRERLLKNWYLLCSLIGQGMEGTERAIVYQLESILRKAKEEKDQTQFQQLVAELSRYLEGKGEIPSFMQEELAALRQKPATLAWLKIIIEDINQPTICVRNLQNNLSLFPLVARRGGLTEEERSLFMQALASPRLNTILRWIIEHLPLDDLKPLVCFLKHYSDRELLQLMEAWMASTNNEDLIAKGAVSLLPAVTDMQKYAEIRAGINTDNQLKKFTTSKQTRRAVEWLAGMHQLSQRKDLMSSIFMPFLLATPEGTDITTANAMSFFNVLKKYFQLTESFTIGEDLQIIFYESLSSQERRVGLTRVLDEARGIRERYTKEAKEYVELRPELWLGGFEAYLRCLKPLPKGER